MYHEFVSYRFTFTISPIEGMSDVLIYEDDKTKKLKRITFAITEGWFKTVNRNTIPVQADYCCGYISKNQKGIIINRGVEKIIYLKKEILPEDDIY